MAETEFSEPISAFTAHLHGRGSSPCTVRSYASALCAFARWCGQTWGAPFDPAAVTPLDVADYKRHLLNRNRRPATVNLHLDALSAFFGWAVSAGLTPSDPTEGVKRLPEARNAPRWLARKELGALVRAAQKYGSPRDRALLALLLHAGLRVSEAVDLKLQDVVLRERSGHVVVRRGKGEKYREVPLNATARRIIQEWLDAHPGGDYLFPGRNGPVTGRAVQARLAGLGRLAGVEVTPHKLRHTFCKMLVDAGESLDRVAVLAGHANLNTTAKYTRPSLGDLERAVERLAWE